MNNYAAGWIAGWMNGILQTKNLTFVFFSKIINPRPQAGGI